MIRTIVVEDETKSRFSLVQKLSDFCPAVQVIAEAEDGLKALELIEELRPQLVFLDIEMPKMNGFEMLSNIRNKDFHVIFTTAYDQYAIKAIKYSALDYLLKPIDIEELKSAVQRVSTIDMLPMRQQLDLLELNISQSKNKFNKLALPTLDGLLFFDISDIIYLEAESNYTYIFFTNKSKVTASKTLKDFEELLPKNTFFRPHHSYIINLNFIKKYIKGDGGSIELQNGKYIDVSRRRKEEFLKIIGR